MYPKYKCSISEDDDDDDEDDDDDDEDAVEEDSVQLKKYFCINCVPGGVSISVPHPERGVPFAAQIFSRFT